MPMRPNTHCPSADPGVLHLVMQFPDVAPRFEVPGERVVSCAEVRGGQYRSWTEVKYTRSTFCLSPQRATEYAKVIGDDLSCFPQALATVTAHRLTVAEAWREVDMHFPRYRRGTPNRLIRGIMIGARVRARPVDDVRTVGQALHYSATNRGRGLVLIRGHALAVCAGRAIDNANRWLGLARPVREFYWIDDAPTLPEECLR